MLLNFWLFLFTNLDLGGPSIEFVRDKVIDFWLWRGSFSLSITKFKFYFFKLIYNELNYEFGELEFDSFGFEELMTNLVNFPWGTPWPVVTVVLISIIELLRGDFLLLSSDKKGNLLLGDCYFMSFILFYKS